MDVWFETVVKPRMMGKVFMVRFADDLIVGFFNVPHSAFGFWSSFLGRLNGTKRVFSGCTVSPNLPNLLGRTSITRMASCLSENPTIR